MIGPFRVKPHAILPFTIELAPAIPIGASIDSVAIRAYALASGDEMTSRIIVDNAPTATGTKVTIEYKNLVEGRDYGIEVVATLDTGDPNHKAVETVIFQCRR